MTERFSTAGIDGSIRCDICGEHGFYDPRDPWETWILKPIWRCDTCKKAVQNATEQQRYLNERRKISS